MYTCTFLCHHFHAYTYKYVPGSLYAICRAHRNIDGLRGWRMRSHAYSTCIIHKRLVFLFLFSNLGSLWFSHYSRIQVLIFRQVCRFSHVWTKVQSSSSCCSCSSLLYLLRFLGFSWCLCFLFAENNSTSRLLFCESYSFTNGHMWLPMRP